VDEGRGRFQGWRTVRSMGRSQEAMTFGFLAYVTKWMVVVLVILSLNTTQLWTDYS
jgi:hypothetical protein